jgi:non-lysosomal glucosylceramidase
VHDRYHASRRNPWNEIECGDHYARSMASYGVYLAACGFEYDGPRGHIGFAPRLTPEDFKCAFTSAEGWGTFSQQSETTNLKAQIAVKWGTLRLKTIAFNFPAATSARVMLDGKLIQATVAKAASQVTLTFAEDVLVAAGQALEIRFA